MAIILNIDTSGKNCSVSLSNENNIICTEEYFDKEFIHSEKLHLFIKNITEKTIIDINKIDAVSINKGPGSFTGLRIGSSSAKGICFALNKPLIAIDSLEILTSGFLKISNMEIEDRIILFPVIDAKNDNVYKCEYNIYGNRTGDLEFISLKNFTFRNDKKYVFFGDGTDIVKKYFKGNNCKYQDNIEYTSSTYMTPLSLMRYKSKQFENLNSFEPLYVKNFIVNKK